MSSFKSEAMCEHISNMFQQPFPIANFLNVVANIGQNLSSNNCTVEKRWLRLRQVQTLSALKSFYLQQASGLSNSDAAQLTTSCRKIVLCKQRMKKGMGGGRGSRSRVRLGFSLLPCPSCSFTTPPANSAKVRQSILFCLFTLMHMRNCFMKKS